MRRLLEILKRPRHYPWIALGIAVAVLVPRLGCYGFLEPREIAVADSASRWLEHRSGGTTTDNDPTPEPEAPEARQPREEKGQMVGSGAGEPGSGAGEPGMASEPGAAPDEPKKRPPDVLKPARAKKQHEPRFTERLVAYGVSVLGFSELGARWPLALLGLVAVMAAYFLGARLASPRAGLVASLVLLSFPLFVLESRQLTSEIGAVTGSALLFLGLSGLALPARWDRLFAARGNDLAPAALVACDFILIAAGEHLAMRADGLLLGVVPPLAGLGMGVLVWSALDRQSGERVSRPTLAVGLCALAGGAAALLLFFHGTLTWVEAGEGDRHIFGWTLLASTDDLPALGAAWKDHGDVQTPFSAMFEQIGFGLFPWIVLAPIALGRLALGLDGDDGGGAPRRPGWVGPALFGWAALAWIIGAIVTRKVTPVLYPGLVAVAVGIGVWLDSVLSRRAARSDPDAADAGGPLPLVALFVFFAALVLAKDLVSAPDELTSLNTPGTTVKYPEGAHLHRGVAGFGILFALALPAGLFFWRGPYQMRWGSGARDLLGSVGRWGIHAAVAVGVLFSFFLSQAWVPGLSARMSSRDVLALYRQLKVEGDQLGIFGNLGTGPAYYAGGDYVKLDGRKDLFEFLQRPERVFALVRSQERCPVHKEATKRKIRYHVLDDQNTQVLLLSNQLKAGEKDRNQLDEMILREPPTVEHKVSAVFEDQLELVGVSMPKKVDKGDSFEMALFYKVLKPVTRSWRIFVHVDRGSRRLIGDHSPLRGMCALTYLLPGDYIVDTFEVPGGDRGDPDGAYKVWTGFFTGSNPNWTNMKVTAGQPDRDNRVPLGEIVIE